MCLRSILKRSDGGASWNRCRKSSTPSGERDPRSTITSHVTGQMLLDLLRQQPRHALASLLVRQRAHLGIDSCPDLLGQQSAEPLQDLEGVTGQLAAPLVLGESREPTAFIVREGAIDFTAHALERLEALLHHLSILGGHLLPAPPVLHDLAAIVLRQRLPPLLDVLDLHLVVGPLHGSARPMGSGGGRTVRGDDQRTEQRARAECDAGDDRDERTAIVHQTPAITSRVMASKNTPSCSVSRTSLHSSS